VPSWTGPEVKALDGRPLKYAGSRRQDRGKSVLDRELPGRHHRRLTSDVVTRCTTGATEMGQQEAFSGSLCLALLPPWNVRYFFQTFQKR
jgi:hypothetical protein